MAESDSIPSVDPRGKVKRPVGRPRKYLTNEERDKAVARMRNESAKSRYLMLEKYVELGKQYEVILCKLIEKGCIVPDQPNPTTVSEKVVVGSP